MHTCSGRSGAFPRFGIGNKRIIMSIYFDNAATTPLHREVFAAMEPLLFGHFGNPSSAHHHGRAARLAVETARKSIAGLLSTAPANILFTSGGTEADNTAIRSAILQHGLRVAITSRLEHHAVLNTLRALEKADKIRLLYMEHDACGNLSLAHLEHLLASQPRALVSVMHANNEIGNLNDIATIGELCRNYDAVFHSDTVQTMGHYHYPDTAARPDFLVGSAHKFHGPKGVGFLCCSRGAVVHPLVRGGGQEQGRRAGTENVAGIVGLARALEIAYRDLPENSAHVRRLKERMIQRLRATVPDVRFNGNSGRADSSLGSLVSVSLPPVTVPVLQALDRKLIAASGGSACTSGSLSHVLEAIGTDSGRTTVRFSFSRFNSLAEVDQVADQLAIICADRELVAS